MDILIALRKLHELRSNARLSRSDFEAHKLRKFRTLVAHAYQHSPFYRQLIDDRRIDIANCSVSDFPVLTKTILMQNFDQLVTDRKITKQAVAEFLTRSTDPNDLFLNRYHVLHTSGSSGEVGYFLFSSQDWTRSMAQSMRRRSSAPRPARRRRGRIRVAFYGAIGGHFAGVSMASGATRGIARFAVNLGLYEVNDPLPKVVARLNEFQPEMISGYTTALKILAQKQREGSLHIAPAGIGTGGEAMTAADQQELSDAFKCPVYGSYACTEHLLMGACIDGKTITLYDDDLIYEFYDDHSVVTNLFNFTLPLIRYRMSDILRPLPHSDQPPYLQIESLVGRAERLPAFLNRDGVRDFVSPHTINEIFVAGVTRFQMQLLGDTHFRFRICLDQSLNREQQSQAVAGVGRRLREILDQKLMTNVTFEVVVVDDIPINARTRKFQLIVDQREAP